MIALPAIRRANQGRAMLLGYLAFSALYLGSGTLHLTTPTTLVPGAIDAAIPLVDWTVWIYLSQFLLLPARSLLRATTPTAARPSTRCCWPRSSPP
jgi:hypothetical protein